MNTVINLPEPNQDSSISLEQAITKRRSQRKFISKALIGQSHIGPPATIGWALVNDPRMDFSELAADGIGFVGDITLVDHPLQLSAILTYLVSSSRTWGRFTNGFIFSLFTASYQRCL